MSGSLMSDVCEVVLTGIHTHSRAYTNSRKQRTSAFSSYDGKLCLYTCLGLAFKVSLHELETVASPRQAQMCVSACLCVGVCSLGI